MLELSIVIFLMAILLGFSLPRFSVLFESKLTRETKKIAHIINELRVNAILNNESYQIIFDLTESTYTVLTEEPSNPGFYSPHKKYTQAVRLESPVEFLNIKREKDENEPRQFAGREIVFDKIFGQEHSFKIDSSGFIDLFSVKIKNDDKYLTLSVDNIMGKISISNEGLL